MQRRVMIPLLKSLKTTASKVTSSQAEKMAGLKFDNIKMKFD